MKLLKTTQSTLAILCLALSLNACAGGEEGVDDEFEANGEENAANVEGEEGFNEENGGNENFGNNENAGENENFGNEGNEENLGNEGNVAEGNNLMNNDMSVTGNEAPANEFVNNAAGENFLNAGAGEVAAEDPMANPTADAALAENSSEDLGIAPSDDIVEVNQNTAMQADPNMGATDASLAVPEESAAPTQVAPMSGGRVHYVMASGTSGYDRPSGQVVKTYEQGDHPLVSADGEWVRTSDGAYIQGSALTTKPVSRAKSPKAWR